MERGNERFIRITCSEGNTQSLKELRETDDPNEVFESYKSRVCSVRDTHTGANPGLTDEWIDGLKYDVEVNVWVYDYSKKWSDNGWRLISVSTYDGMGHSYYKFRYKDNRGIEIGAVSLPQAVERLENFKEDAR